MECLLPTEFTYQGTPHQPHFSQVRSVGVPREELSVARGSCEIYFKLLIRSDIWPSSGPNSPFLQKECTYGVLAKHDLSRSWICQQDPQFLINLCGLFQATCPDFYSRISVTHVHKKSILGMADAFLNSFCCCCCCWDLVKHTGFGTRKPGFKSWLHTYRGHWVASLVILMHVHLQKMLKYPYKPDVKIKWEDKNYGQISLKHWAK